MLVGLVTVTPVAAAPPRVTVTGLTKFVPVIVMGVPPRWDPLAGLIVVTIGSAR